jgi:MFS family permease
MSADPATLTEAWPSRRAAWAMLVLLMATMAASQIDRSIINLLVEPLKVHFTLTDTQFGALQGIAFGMFYTVFALPIGMLADRLPRRVVVGVCIGLFSLFSAATGLVRNYAQLFIARAGVGVGEAGVAPAGFSLISDSFPPDQLGRATSLFTMSSSIGSAIALIGGGALIGGLEATRIAEPELLRGLQPWQWAFILAALPGAVLAPFYFLMREPARRGEARDRTRIPLTALLGEMRRLGAFLALLLVGMSMVTTTSYATGVWSPALFIRVYGWEAREIGMWLGVMTLVGGVIGSLVAGSLVDHFARRRLEGAPMLVAAAAFAGCGLTGALAPLMPTAELSMALFAVMHLLLVAPYACAPVAIQLAVGDRFRSQVAALYLTAISLVGLLIGPVLVGAMTDHLFSSPKDVRYSLSIVVAIAAPVMCAALLLARGPYLRLIERRA